MRKIILINIIVSIFILIFLELIANFFKISNLMGIEPGLIGNYKNNIHRMIPNSSGIHFGQKIFIDSNGYRVPYKDYRYNNSNNSVSIIGDSTAFGNGVREENTFVGILRKNSINWNFYNTSVPGYQIRHFKENLETIDNINNIKKVFYFITLNDIFDSSNIVDLGKKTKNIVTETQNKKVDFLKNIKIINELNAFLRSKSYLYMYIKGIATDPSKRYFKNILIHYSKNDLEEMNVFLNQLREKTIKKNIKLKVFILPYEFQTRNCNKRNLLPQDKLNNILLNLKIDFVDYTLDFCNYKNPKSLFYKFDPMHLSKKGHSLVFNLVKNEM
tara:strand:+ start:53 stop:1039 length:987 start_codon:yes stop_codon:yes gene_type:complete